MIDERVLVERLDIQKGDLVLVVVPEDVTPDEMCCIADSFGELENETKKGATYFVVPSSLRFKVIRESEA